MDKLILKQQNSKPIMYKSFGCDIKAEKESRIVSGYLSAFGNKDSDGDILIKGCFSKSLQERGVNSTTDRKIAYLYQHKMDMPIGHFTKLEEDDFGLYFEAYLDKIPLGDQVLEQYSSGTLNQHSIGYRYIWDKIEYDENLDAFIVKEINLFEGSVVTIGANENTPFTGMKTEEIESQKNQLDRETEKVLKGFDYSTAITIRQLITKHIALCQVEPDIKSSLKEKVKPQQGFDLTKINQSLNF